MIPYGAREKRNQILDVISTFLDVRSTKAVNMAEKAVAAFHHDSGQQEPVKIILERNRRAASEPPRGA